ncbi:hypothetical protein Syun_016476 [Stephania yunnanensis]|uniref:DUF4378 domain-containing protein n=1 Tax=Stephania yunnanensis TaxID=152371 RepID=A0AAP0J541_9MAGN
MMSSKHLRDLLTEAQEPFVLKNYINDKHNQLNRPNRPNRLHKSQLHLKRRTPISRLRRNSCFLSFHDYSPSPLFVRTPCRSPNALLVQIPAHTASLLLERARRIQRRPNSATATAAATATTQKPKSPKELVFGFFGSILRKISHKKRNLKQGIEGGGVNECGVVGGESGFDEMGFSCSSNSNHSRLSSVWSESNEDKSLDFDSSSCSSDDDDEGFVDSSSKGFSTSPFRFVLQSGWASSPGPRTPEFASPAPSLRKQVLEKEEGSFECEEDGDQSSPVSVFDPPFEDDGNDGMYGYGEDGHDGYELEHSIDIVQRAKQKFLHKMRRFERLAELEPIELEKKLIEEDEESDLSDDEEGEEAFVREVLRMSNMHYCRKVPRDMKILVLDLVAEEQNEEETDLNIAMKVCDRLDSWKEVEMNTIDMMVEFDFRRQAEEWKRNLDQVQEMAIDIELSIVSYLVEELSCELCHSS